MRCCLYLKCSLSRLSVDYNCCQFCRKRNSKQIFEFLCSLELKTIGLQESSLNHPATPLYIIRSSRSVLAVVGLRSYRVRPNAATFYLMIFGSDSHRRQSWGVGGGDPPILGR